MSVPVLLDTSVSPSSQHRLPTTTIASWHGDVFSCHPGGSPPGSSRPSILITFQQTGQFVGPNPPRHKGHNGAHSGPLSPLDLLLPTGRPHFLMQCLDRQILAAVRVRTRVCVCAWPAHALGLSEFDGTYCSEGWLR